MYWWRHMRLSDCIRFGFRTCHVRVGLESGLCWPTHRNLLFCRPWFGLELVLNRCYVSRQILNAWPMKTNKPCAIGGRMKTDTSTNVSWQKWHHTNIYIGQATDNFSKPIINTESKPIYTRISRLLSVWCWFRIGLAGGTGVSQLVGHNVFSKKKILCICDNICVNYFEKARKFVNMTSSSSDQNVICLYLLPSPHWDLNHLKVFWSIVRQFVIRLTHGVFTWYFPLQVQYPHVEAFRSPVTQISSMKILSVMALRYGPVTVTLAMLTQCKGFPHLTQGLFHS